jgi:hypothetical protein
MLGACGPRRDSFTIPGATDGASFPPLAKVYPPGTRYWWPNFTGYACGGRAMEVALMDTFRIVERKNPSFDPALAA